MPLTPRLARRLAEAMAGEHATRVADGMRFQDAGHGYDPFGMHPDYVALGAAIGRAMHDGYFRATSHGAHHIPAEGAAILAANHSGTLPFDGMVLWSDVVANTNPPRAARPVADYFVSSLPFIGTLFQRSGMVGGSRGNVRRLLESGELIMLFPEGTPGIGKPFSDRYRLQTWRKGHVEFSIRYRAPIVPVGIVGAEEQMPQIARIPLKPLGLKVPYLPVPATPLPMPVHYHILYGPPLRFDQEFEPADADDPEIVTACAARVKAAVQKLLHQGLRTRAGVFA